MNTGRTSEERLSWTTEGLNTMLPIYDAIQALRITAEERSASFVSGTLSDATSIKNAIMTRLRAKNNKIGSLQKQWTADFWYNGPMPDLVLPAKDSPKQKLYRRWFAEMGSTRPSEKLHHSWFSFISVYVRNQKTWDNEQAAVWVDAMDIEDESDVEDDEEDECSEMEDEDQLTETL